MGLERRNHGSAQTNSSAENRKPPNALLANRRHPKETTRTRRKKRPPFKDGQNNRSNQPGYSNAPSMHLRGQSVFLHLQQGGKRNGALLGSLR